MTREAVIGETPACLATSRMVTVAPALRLRWGILDPPKAVLARPVAGGVSLLVRARWRLRRAAEIAIGFRRQPGEHRVCGHVLRQRGRVDLVERVVGVVV